MAPRRRQRTLFEYPLKSPARSSPNRAYSARSNPVDIDSDSSDPSNLAFEQPKSNPHESMSLLTDEDNSSDPETQVPSPTKAGKRKVISSDEENLNKSCCKKTRRIVRGKRPSPSPRGDDDNGSQDEAENLLEEVDGELIIEERLRKRNGKSAYFKNLERLKRRRNVQRSRTVTSGESGSDSDTGNYSDGHVAPDNDYILGACPTETLGRGDDDEDDGFIVEDDDEGVVIPDLPPEFSMSTFQDLSNHFKVVCQLFIHLAATKPRKRRLFIKDALQNTYFSVPLAFIRRKLSGIRDSLIASSVWRADFKNTLEKYPDFHLTRLDFVLPRCDACHLGGRLSTLQGILSGTEYNKETYEPLDPGEEATVITWDLGRYCAARVQIYHTFTHWEHTLYHSLRAEVETLGSVLEQGTGFLSATSGPPPPENLEDADGIMEWLDGRRVIDSEWHRLKEMMDRAHNLEAKGKNDEDIALS